MLVLEKKQATKRLLDERRREKSEGGIQIRKDSTWEFTFIFRKSVDHFVPLLIDLSVSEFKHRSKQ